ncbi:MAG: TetR/AcrR family transcriptional regulator [Methylococcales bacterium]|nr:MAG: TetR/AcrR family transcriptional regulator [Methylococcales bacterium]
MDQEIEILNITPQTTTSSEISIAALKLFATKGYFNTSLTDIAKMANIKNTSEIYQHFTNKQVIAAQLYVDIFANLNESIDEIWLKNDKPSEQLRGTVDLLFKLTEDAPDVMRFLLNMKFNEFLPDEKPLQETPAFCKIYKIIQAGITNGEIRNIDPMMAYIQFFGIVNTTIQGILAGVLDKKADTYLLQTWLAAWNGIVKK